MRQIRILAPYEDYQTGYTPTVLGSRGRQLVGLGVAEWVVDQPAAAAAPIAKAARKAVAKKAPAKNPAKKARR
jgi:hypothetical protein